MNITCHFSLALVIFAGCQLQSQAYAELLMKSPLQQNLVPGEVLPMRHAWNLPPSMEKQDLRSIDIWVGGYGRMAVVDELRSTTYYIDSSSSFPKRYKVRVSAPFAKGVSGLSLRGESGSVFVQQITANIGDVHGPH
jgi:hypothetical protein